MEGSHQGDPRPPQWPLPACSTPYRSLLVPKSSPSTLSTALYITSLSLKANSVTHNCVSNQDHNKVGAHRAQYSLPTKGPEGYSESSPRPI